MSGNTTAAHDYTQSASTMAQSLSIPAISSATSLKGSVDPPKPTTTASQIASLASPQKSLKRPSSPSFELPPPLTGAAAMAENARQRELEEQRQAQMTSVNAPAATKNVLMGGGDFGKQQSSAAPDLTRPSNPPPPSSSTSSANATSEPTSILRNSITTSEPIPIEPTQTSPISMTGSESANSANVFAVNNHGSVDSSKTNTSAEFSNAEERSNKAMTYPPQIMPGDSGSRVAPSTPARGMSMPGGVRSPNSSKKHKCPHCSTEFTRHHNLKSHLLTHSHEKPYGCHQCSSRFRRLHDLKRHTKLHTGERPHTCPKCGRKFARGDALARHSKGPGGCAGRRGSMGGGDGDYDDSVMDPDMSMDGVEYTDEMDGETVSPPNTGGSRRRSEPNRARKQSLNQQGNLHSSPGPGVGGSGAHQQPPYRQHSNTYPPGLVAPQAPAMGRGASPSRTLYPPGAGSHQDPSLPSSASTTMSTSNRHLSPKSALDRNGGGSYFNSHPGSASNNSANIFSQPNINLTESPKALSPGSVAHTGVPSSSLTSSAASVAGGQNLLPPLSGLASGSAMPSLSSSSMVTGGAGVSSDQKSIEKYLREMEERLNETQRRLHSQEEHYEAKISQLQNELSSLRGAKGLGEAGGEAAAGGTATSTAAALSAVGGNAGGTAAASPAAAMSFTGSGGGVGGGGGGGGGGGQRR